MSNLYCLPGRAGGSPGYASATPSEVSTRERARQNVTFWCVASRRQSPMMANMENPPAKRALATLDNPPPADVTAPAKRISKRVSRAIDLMVSGDCKLIKDAADKVWLAR